MKNKMADMPINKLVFTLSLPLMASLLVQSLYNIVDSVFVGMLSQQALAAVGVAYPVQLLMIAAGVGTGVGANAWLSKCLGAKDKEGLRQGADTSLFLVIVMTAIFCLTGMFGTHAIANALCNDVEMAQDVESYLSICLIFSGGSLAATMFQRFLQASGDAFWSMVSLIAGALTNIILDPIFIFQFNLGIAGAAWATIIGQWISALAAIYLNHTKNPNIRPQFPLQISSKAIQDIYRVGAPAIAVQASQSVMAAGLNAILLPVSSSAVAFLSVYIKLQSFLFMPLNGLGQAAIPIIGFNSGAKRMDRAKQCQRTVLKSGILLSVICALAFFFFSKPLLTLFSLEGEALNLGIQAMKVLALTFPMGAITLLLGNCASGLQNGIINLAGTILRQIFPLLPLCQWFLSLGIHNMWYAFLPSEAIALITTTILSTRLWKKRTQNEKVPGLQA